MFWEHEDWSALDAGELAGALALVRAGLPKHEEDAFALPGERDEPHASDEEQLRVRSIRVRRLCFYPDHWLYELGLSLEAAGFASRYESARAFVVVSPVDAPGTPPPEVGAALPPHRRPALAGRADAVSATLLDWTSGVLYQLNERARMRLAPGGRVDRQLALDYLDFFVSFIAGTDSRELFLLLDGGTLAQPAGIPRRRASLPSFEQAVSARVLDGKAFERRARWNYIPANPSDTDEPDVAWIEPEPNPERGPSPDGQAADEGARDTPGHATSPAAPATDDAPAFDPASHPIEPIRMGEQPPDRVAIEFLGSVLYERAIFTARFELSCEPDGTTQVRMLDDAPQAGADPALLQYQVGRLEARGIRLLLLLKSRTEVSAAGFLAQLRKATATNALSPAAWVENLRVSGDVNLQLLDAGGPVRVRDVEFMGRVVLDECRRDASVVFERCRIARSFEARNCVIDGDLVLRGTEVMGATASGDPLRPSVCLAGLRLTGGLEAQQLAVDGEFAASNVDIGGSAALCGADFRRRRDSESFGINMRNASVRSGLDLSPHVVRDGVAQQRVSRSRVEGTIDLVGLHALRADLRGLACAAVDLSYARLEGAFDLGPFDPAAENVGAIGNRQMRAIVFGYVDLRCAQAREVILAGANIAGEFWMINAEIHGNLFAVPAQYGYRCRIGGKAVLSSARIQGDADFDGAEIVGGFEMRTGSLGRLFMSIHPALRIRDEEVRLDWFAAEVARIELIGVSGLGTIGLAGIQVRGAAGQPTALLIEHVESRGDIRFYWETREATMFSRVLATLPGEPRWQRGEASPRTCSATVHGDIEMRRIITGGHIDLTNLKVIGGSVRLNDARIGTDLFARRSWLRGSRFMDRKDRCADGSDGAGEGFALAMQCEGLDLDNAHIEGDAILSGIELGAGPGGDGRLRGRGLAVGGTLEFYAGKACMARIEGGIDLAGASAAQLILPGSGALCPGSSESSPVGAPAAEGRIVLERCRLGKLQIDEPIPRLDLTGIQVANWKLGKPGANGEHSDVERKIAILSQMDPMDRSVWIGVESELRNESRVRDADRVYREMKHREPVSPFRALPKALSRSLYGYGTRVGPALALWLALSLALFAMLRQPDNVKVSDGVLLQLGGQCRSAQERAAPGAALPAKCASYFAAIGGSAAPALEITAAQLAAAGAQSGYDAGDAALLSLRYAIPFVGAFGDPDWVPAEQSPARIGTANAVPVDVGLAPSILAAVVLLVNSLLLSFAAAFVAKRWLR